MVERIGDSARRAWRPLSWGLVGLVLVLVVLALLGWPGGWALTVAHMAVGGVLTGTWGWTQVNVERPIVRTWWLPVVGLGLVVIYPLALSDGWLVWLGVALAAALALVSVGVATDCAARSVHAEETGHDQPRQPTPDEISRARWPTWPRAEYDEVVKNLTDSTRALRRTTLDEHYGA